MLWDDSYPLQKARPSNLRRPSESHLKIIAVRAWQQFLVLQLTYDDPRRNFYFYREFLDVLFGQPMLFMQM